MLPASAAASCQPESLLALPALLPLKQRLPTENSPGLQAFTSGVALSGTGDGPNNVVPSAGAAADRLTVGARCAAAAAAADPVLKVAGSLLLASFLPNTGVHCQKEGVCRVHV